MCLLLLAVALFAAQLRQAAAQQPVNGDLYMCAAQHAQQLLLGE
jgi:hypothetical protein